MTEFDDGLLADLADLVLNVGQEIKMLATDGPSIPLTLTESNVMRFVDRHPGTSPSALADGTGLHRSNMSAALRSLEDKGMIARAHDGEDGRAITVAPTAMAATNLVRLRNSWSTGLREGLEGDLDGLDQSIAFMLRLEAGLARHRTSQS